MNNGTTPPARLGWVWRMAGAWLAGARGEEEGHPQKERAKRNGTTHNKKEHSKK